MPAVVAILIRGLIQAIVTTGILTAAESLLLPLLNKAIQEVAEFFGCTEEEAKDIIANKYLQFAETAGVLLLTLRTKTPTLIAERLGFTSKGFSLRKLSPTLAAKVEGAAVTGTVATVATAVEVEKVAQVVAANKGLSGSIVTTLLKYIMGFVGATAAILLAIGNFIDFANWQGAYQKTFQDIFTALGFPPDTPMPKAKSVSADTWSKIYTIVEKLNPESIAFPWDGVTKPYSRANLADAVDHFAANLALHGQQATWKNVWGLLLPCIKLKGSPSTGTGISTSAIVAQATSTVPKVQVYTGIISQGVLGSGASFQARTNDMIDDVKELIDSASVNLAGFLTSLPSRVTYEVKIVSSITTKDGFTQRGTTTKVISSYNRDGTPRYKNVTNKFAVLNLYLLTDKNTRTKIATINVGPVNSVNFNVNTNDLNSIASHLQQVATTTDTGKINTVTSTTPIVTQPPVPAAPVVTQPVTPIVTQTQTTATPAPQGQHYVIGLYGSKEVWTDTTLDNIKKAYPNGPWKELTKAEWDAYGQVQQSAPTSAPTVATTTNTNTTTQAVQPVVTSPPAVRPGANATNLSEWYTANGKSLPTVSERSILYEQYGLGSRNLYIGSAEQNTRLLDKLKGF